MTVKGLIQKDVSNKDCQTGGVFEKENRCKQLIVTLIEIESELYWENFKIKAKIMKPYVSYHN